MWGYFFKANDLCHLSNLLENVFFLPKRLPGREERQRRGTTAKSEFAGCGAAADGAQRSEAEAVLSDTRSAERSMVVLVGRRWA